MAKRQCKVYGMTSPNGGRQVACCSSLKRFAELVDSSYYYVSHMACETGNDYEVKRAVAKPDTLVFISREEDSTHSN